MCVRGKDEILVSTPNHKAVIFFNTNGLWSDRRRNSSFIGRRDCAEKLIFRAEEDTQYNRSWRSTFINAHRRVSDYRVLAGRNLRDANHTRQDRVMLENTRTLNLGCEFYITPSIKRFSLESVATRDTIKHS